MDFLIPLCHLGYRLFGFYRILVRSNSLALEPLPEDMEGVFLDKPSLLRWGALCLLLQIHCVREGSLNLLATFGESLEFVFVLCLSNDMNYAVFRTHPTDELRELCGRIQPSVFNPNLRSKGNLVME